MLQHSTYRPVRVSRSHPVLRAIGRAIGVVLLLAGTAVGLLLLGAVLQTLP